MLKNSLALRNTGVYLFFAAALFAAVSVLPAQAPVADEIQIGQTGADGTANDLQRLNEIRWYRSNSAGMALEFIPSRLAVMRYEYSLSARNVPPSEIPVLLRPYFVSSYRVELRILHEYGEEIRRQWIFRDGGGTTRLTASGARGLFGEENARAPDGEDSQEERRTGFIEIRNSDGSVTREFQFDEDLSEWEFRYTYRDGVLIRTETWYKEPPPAPQELSPEENSGEEDPEEEGAQSVSAPEPVRPPVFLLAYTDNYRYSRSASLRAIDRTLHMEMGGRARLGFPRLGPGSFQISDDLVFHGGAYSSDRFIESGSVEGATISYNLDSRGRVQGEIWRDCDGRITGELTNNWSGDRLQSVLWKSDDDNRLIEFEYDREGNLTVERTFRHGVLERVVIYEDEKETEEIYMNGRLILKAHWENGVKVLEERVMGGGPR